MSQLRIFIAEPDRNGRLALQMFLDHQPGMEVVGIAVQKQGLVEQVTTIQPDVVLIDWKLMSSTPAALINELHDARMNCQIIVMDVREETSQEVEVLGIDKFVRKDGPPDKLLSTLQELKRNKTTHNS
jgi:DNA-binding NarL/FixJ family response regulator